MYVWIVVLTVITYYPKAINTCIFIQLAILLMIVVSNPDNGLVVHLLDATINLLPYGFLCSLGSQYIEGSSFIMGGTCIFQCAICLLTLGAHAQ